MTFKSSPHPVTKFLAGRKYVLVEAPVSFGQSLTGVDTAPTVLQECGLNAVVKNLKWELAGVEKVQVTPPADLCEKVTDFDEERMYTDKEVLKGRQLGWSLQQVHETVFKWATEGVFVVTIGGDHSIATATISAMLRKHENLCVVWVDAHADANTPETSGSLKYHGMPVAHLFRDKFAKEVPGFDWLSATPKLSERRLGYIGLRQVDDGERTLIAKHNIVAMSMTEVDELKIAMCVKNVLAAIDPQCERPIHLSFDIDACDPTIAPGTGTRARGGLTYREAHYVCEALSKTCRLVSMDMVEINPCIDEVDEALHGDDEHISIKATKTVRLGIELIASSLGKAILL